MIIKYIWTEKQLKHW